MVSKAPVVCLFCDASPCECGKPKRVARRPSATVRPAVASPAPSLPVRARASTRPALREDELLEIVALQNLSGLLHHSVLDENAMKLKYELSHEERLRAFMLMLNE